MSVAKRYLAALGLWTVGLTGLFLLVGVTGPGAEEVVWAARLPGLLAFALALGSLPAGVAVGRTVLTPSAARGSRLAILVAASVVGSALMFVTVSRWGPAALSAGAGPPGPDGGLEVARLTSPELRAAATAALPAAEAAGPGRIEDWREINTIVWELDRRVAHATLPFLLTWVGVFAGHFAARTRRRELRLAMLWALGLLLVVSLYLAGENSYELIVLRAGDRVFFAASFIVFVPAALFGTLGWAAAMDVFGSREPPA